jgi:hypothetical protein
MPARIPGVDFMPGRVSLSSSAITADENNPETSDLHQRGTEVEGKRAQAGANETPWLM